jgi:hypothetical protein
MLSAMNLAPEGCRLFQDSRERLRNAEREGAPYAFFLLDPPPGPKPPSVFLQSVKKNWGLARPPLCLLEVSRILPQTPAVLYRAGMDAIVPQPINPAFLEDTLLALLDDAAEGSRPRGDAPRPKPGPAGPGDEPC